MPFSDPLIQKLAASAVNAKRARILRARTDPMTFMQVVLRDEQTGKPIRMAPIHQAWQHLLSTHDRLVVWSHVESGKTSQVSVGRTLFELAKDPTLRVLILSNTHGQAAKIVRTIARYVETSEDLRMVASHMAPGLPWTSSSLSVQRPFISKDPSVQATGVHGNVLGSRLDLVIVDDVLDYENARSPEQRQQLWDWLQSTVFGRLTERARVWVVGTAFHPDDALHRFARTPGYFPVHYPALDPETGLSRWPEQWSQARIEKKRAELGPVEFARQMLCVARDEASSVFKRAWVEVALRRGEDREMAYALTSVPRGCYTVTGVDLAVQTHSSADLTVLFTILMHPNGDREVLWIEAGRWQGPEILHRIGDAHRRYQSLVYVENNAAQDYLVQMLQANTAIPVRGYTTGKTKAHPEFGVQGLAAEMANGKWIIPNQKGALHPEVQAWVDDMLNYDPRAHTGDRLMACWLAKEGLRAATVKAETGRLDLMAR